MPAHGQRRDAHRPTAEQARSSSGGRGPDPETGAEARAPQEAETRTERRGVLAAALQALPYVLAGAALIGYFLWLILQMSIHAYGGRPLPEAIFGGVALGVAGGAAAVLGGRRGGGGGS